MRWQSKALGWFDRDQKRIQHKFLFIPRCINGAWRWLECAMWEEKVELFAAGQYKWFATKWVEHES